MLAWLGLLGAGVLLPAFVHAAEEGAEAWIERVPQWRTTDPGLATLALRLDAQMADGVLLEVRLFYEAPGEGLLAILEPREQTPLMIFLNRRMLVFDSLEGVVRTMSLAADNGSALQLVYADERLELNWGTVGDVFGDETRQEGRPRFELDLRSFFDELDRSRVEEADHGWSLTAVNPRGNRLVASFDADRHFTALELYGQRGVLPLLELDGVRVGAPLRLGDLELPVGDLESRGLEVHEVDAAEGVEELVAAIFVGLFQGQSSEAHRRTLARRLGRSIDWETVDRHQEQWGPVLGEVFGPWLDQVAR